MKLLKSLSLLSSVLFVSASLTGQIVYEERFDSDPGLQIVDNDGLVNSSNNTETWLWSSVFRHFANGTVTTGNYAMRSITNPFPAVNGQHSDDWIILPQITLPSNAQVVFEFCAEWQYKTWEGAPELQVKVSTTDDQLSSFTTISTVTVNNSRFQIESADLSAYAGQNVYIAFVNHCENPPGWGWKKVFLDNIQVGTFPDHDLQGFTFIATDWVKTNSAKTITSAFVNRGTQTVNSLDLNYRVNGGSVVTSTINNLNLSQHDTVWIDHPTSWTPTIAGAYNVEVWASSLNGNADENINNDTLIRDYSVYDKVVSKRPLMEFFSGADCGACAPLAADIDPFIDSWGWNNEYGYFSAIEYQTYNTDPSDNDDAQMRDSYYSVSGYPDEQISDVYDYRTLLFDRWQKSIYPFFNPKHSMISAYPGFIDMSLDVNITGNTINVTANATPLKDISGNMVMHIAVCEKEYTYTGGSTSQNVFKHVMRKMLPDGNGTILGPLTDGVQESVSDSYTFTIGNVTEGSYNLWVGMDNLEVVAFIQDPATDTVYQSVALNVDDLTAAKEYTHIDNPVKVYPVPTERMLYVESGSSREIKQLEVASISGKVVLESVNGGMSPNTRLDVSDLPGGFYVLSVFAEKRELIGTRKFTVSE